MEITVHGTADCPLGMVRSRTGLFLFDKIVFVESRSGKGLTNSYTSAHRIWVS